VLLYPLPSALVAAAEAAAAEAAAAEAAAAEAAVAEAAAVLSGSHNCVFQCTVFKCMHA